MTSELVGIAAVALAYVVVVGVHEIGHYAVGRWLARIPASDISIVLLDFPAHVVLRDGDDWVRPWDPRYGRVYARYDADRARSELLGVDLYTAGGLLGQAVGVAALVGASLLVGVVAWAELLFEVSVLLSGSYLLFDAVASVRSSEGDGYTGDFSALWASSPFGAGTVVAAFAGVHAGLYLLL